MGRSDCGGLLRKRLAATLPLSRRGWIPSLRFTEHHKRRMLAGRTATNDGAGPFMPPLATIVVEAIVSQSVNRI